MQTETDEPERVPTSVAGGGEVADTESARRRLVTKQLGIWTEALVDTSGNNRLLYFRPLKRTLDLQGSAALRKEDLFAGESVRVSELFADAELSREASKRAETLFRKQKQVFEERGIRTLRLGVGMATWQDDSDRKTPPTAPVLLADLVLTRQGGRGKDFTLMIDGNFEPNEALLRVFDKQFGVAVDPAELEAHEAIEDDIDTPEEIQAAIHWIRSKAGAAIPGFAVNEHSVVVDVFMPSRQEMVEDLETSLDLLIENDLIAAMAGDAEASRAIRERQATDVTEADPDFIPPSDEFLICDADSSQNYAINTVLSGKDIVIEGPPGTGKSQTISNLLAVLAARGKKVLFVAEKRAAIDAVLKRLEDADLMDIVLDVHSTGRNRKNRREAVQSIQSALGRYETVGSDDRSHQQDRLAASREALKEHDRSLHVPRDPWRVTLYDVQGRILNHPPEFVTELRLPATTLDGLGFDQFEAASGELRELVGLGGTSLARSGSPWAKATFTTTDESVRAQDLARQIMTSLLPKAEQAFASGAAEAGQQTPLQWDDRFEVASAWGAVASVQKQLKREIWDEDLAELVVALEPLARSSMARLWATLTSSNFRRAKARAREMQRAPLPPDELYVAIAEARRVDEGWSALDAGWEKPNAPTNADVIATGSQELAAACAELSALAGSTYDDVGPAAIGDWVSLLVSDDLTPTRIPRISELRSRLLERGLAGLVDEAEEREVDAEGAVKLFEFAWLQSILQVIRTSDPVVAGYSSEAQSSRASEFTVHDASHIEHTPNRVLSRVAQLALDAANEFPDQARLVSTQATRKGRILPLRDLLTQAPQLMSAAKPCWVMSPSLVSRNLPAVAELFDVVLFDEASQIEPATAIPALMRSKVAAVAGDTKQLPPTAAFKTINQDDSEEDEDEELIEEQVISASAVRDDGSESFLFSIKAVLQQGGSRFLKWHYRSHDERLIAFSNAHFYDRMLNTFPGSVGTDCVRHVLVEPPVLESGDTRRPTREAVRQRVADLVVEHFQTRPRESLGVITMSDTQARKLESDVRARLIDHPHLEPYLRETNEEAFFVKNLENVQGDERDAIILALSYAAKKDGTLNNNFGPLSQEGGERRLNVAVTRAKKRMTLVTAFKSADMNVGSTKWAGAQVLKDYLQYAETSGNDLGSKGSASVPPNPFELHVETTLRKAGLDLVPQFGVGGYRIDLAVKHPERAGEYVLAVECDGASYHSSKTARDRDRLRQEHLERLGWTFHRIWSQDWFIDPQAECDKVVAAFRAAVEAADRRFSELSSPNVESPDQDNSSDNAISAVEASAPPIPEPSESTLVTGLPTREEKPVFEPGLPFEHYSFDLIRDLVKWLRSDGIAHTREQWTEIVLRELGHDPEGTRRVEVIEAALTAVIQDEQVRGSQG